MIDQFAYLVVLFVIVCLEVQAERAFNYVRERCFIEVVLHSQVALLGVKTGNRVKNSFVCLEEIIEGEYLLLIAV